MNEQKIILITGASKGIGEYLVNYYLDKGFLVCGCSRNNIIKNTANYQHFCCDVGEEDEVIPVFREINRKYSRLDILINNAGIASMNHALLTPAKTVNSIFKTNFLGTFLFCREAAKIMQKRKNGRIINFSSIAVPLKLNGEAIYASSKAAINTLTSILSNELGGLGITVNAIGPTPIKTDLIKNIPQEKIERLIERQAIKRFGKYEDVINVIEFFIKPESNFITG